MPLLIEARKSFMASNLQRYRAYGAWTVLVCLLLAATFWFPLFHFLPLKQTQAQETQAEFNPTNYATSFWNKRLLKSLDRAAEAGQVLAALTTDPPKARAQFGRKLGVSSSTLFFLRGTGHVVAVKKNSVALALKDGEETADILLPTGLLFGNAVRDGTGLLDASEFPNSQNFNDVSAELNHIVESTLLLQLREKAKVGAKIFFAGCAEIDDEETDVKPLKVIPVSLKLEAPK
jgi:predicted lipoprotein